MEKRCFEEGCKAILIKDGCSKKKYEGKNEISVGLHEGLESMREKRESPRAKINESEIVGARVSF